MFSLLYTTYVVTTFFTRVHVYNFLIVNVCTCSPIVRVTDFAIAPIVLVITDYT